MLQTFEDFGVLVVENGDSNEAERVVRGFGDPRVRYMYCPRKGAAAARNFGLGHAVGRYIVIHDDNDVMVSSRLNDGKVFTHGQVVSRRADLAGQRAFGE